MFKYNEIFKDKKSILIVSAHPDDSDVFFAGLIAKLIEDNKIVNVLVVTNGARGSRENDISEIELAKQRINEQSIALAQLGLSKEHLFCLDYKDGEVESNFKLIGEISYYLRKLKVDLVCTHEPSLIYGADIENNGNYVQHRDHRKTGEAVIDAVYPFSRDRSFYPEHYAAGISEHSLYDILLTDECKSNFELNIEEVIDKKRKALLSHKSQFSKEDVEEILGIWVSEGKHFEKFNYLKLLW